jgi:hypothetical protein
MGQISMPPAADTWGPDSNLHGFRTLEILVQQARGLHQSTPATEEVRRRRQPDRPGDQGAPQEDAPGAATFRAEAPGEVCKL